MKNNIIRAASDSVILSNAKDLNTSTAVDHAGGTTIRKATLIVHLLTILFLAACSEEEIIAPQGEHEPGLHIAAVTIDGQDVARSRATADGGTFDMDEAGLPFNQSINGLTAGDWLTLMYSFGERFKNAIATLGTDGTWTLTDRTGTPITIAPDKENGEKWADVAIEVAMGGHQTTGNSNEYDAIATSMGVVQGDIPVNSYSLILSDWLVANASYGSITIDTNVKSPTLGAATIALEHAHALLCLPKSAVNVTKGTYIVNGTVHNVTGLGTLWAVVELGGTPFHFPLTEVGNNLQAIVYADANVDYTLTGFKAVMKTDDVNVTLDLPFTVEGQAASSGIAMMPNTRYPLTLTVAPNRSSVTLTSPGASPDGMRRTSRTF